MTIQTREVEDITVLDIQGDLTLADGLTELRTSIEELVEQGAKDILLNAQNVGHVDSCGVGELVRSYTTIRKKGGRIKLLHPTEKLKELLTVTKLLMVFDTYDNEQQALASFST